MKPTYKAVAAIYEDGLETVLNNIPEGYKLHSWNMDKGHFTVVLKRVFDVKEGLC